MTVTTLVPDSAPSTAPRLSWPQVYARLAQAPHGRLFGLGPGGAIVAGLTGRAVDRFEDADAVVVDAADAGSTTVAGRSVWALAERDGSGLPPTFPWSRDDPHDAESAVVRLLESVGEDPTRDGLVETPGRVARAMRELTEGYRVDVADALSRVFDESAEDLVVVRDIPFWSLCEHHLLPFRGTATVGYEPDGRIVGLSKLARVVHAYARRLQVQERMTRQIGEAIQEHLRPHGAAVVVEAEHFCMSMRGVRAPATTVTSAHFGSLRAADGRERFARAARGRLP